MFKRILVTTDFSMHAHYALQRATQFAECFQAELICMHVISQNWFTGSKNDAELAKKKAIKKAELAHADELKRAANSYPIQFIVQMGRTPDQITQYINEQSVDFLFMGAHGTYYLNDFILGTNSQAVIKRSKIPVQLIRKKPTANYQRILVATDFSDVSKQAIETAFQSYPQAEFLLLHVADVWYEKIVEDEMHQELQNKLNHFLDSCHVDASHFTAKFIGGYPANDIAHYATTWGAQLVVIGTRGHSLLHYVLMGRVGERLLRINPTDMLIVPPQQ